MVDEIPEESRPSVWFVYDGDCPICAMAGHALRIKKNIGTLQIINARESREHPLVQEINARGLDLDEGMVLKYQGVCYHGEDALHMMALLGAERGWFNRMNRLLFSSKPLARLCYPAMRAGRNLLLRLKGVGKIRNLQHGAHEPLFKTILGSQWDHLPAVMQKHYAVRPYSDDVVVVKGALDIKIAPFISFLARLSGMLIAYSGEQVPVTVTFRSGKNTRAFYFDRVFHYPDKGDIHFLSCMESFGGNELVEFMGYGIGWRMAYEWSGGKMVLRHRGYVWRLFGTLIPLPLSFIMGEAHAEETPLSENAFSMWTHIKHPWFGEGLRYAGTFDVTEMSCGNPF